MKHLLEVSHVTAGYEGIAVVQDVSFTLAPKEILVIVGESGCGKSTLLKSFLPMRGMKLERLHGTIRFKDKDLGMLSAEEKRQLLGEEISYVFQHPMHAFHPTRRIGTQIEEMMKAHRRYDIEENRSLGKALFLSLGLEEGDRIWQSYPFELSGGMAQRVAIALSVLCKPSLLLADEPTSALDASVQNQVLHEFLRYRDELDMAMVVITHHMGVARKLATTVGVMYAGRLVEYGPANEVLQHPTHPYTQALLRSVPRLGGSLPVGLEGQPPHFKELPTGCAFRERCDVCSSACEQYDYSPYRTDGGSIVLCCRRN